MAPGFCIELLAIDELTSEVPIEVWQITPNRNVVPILQISKTTPYLDTPEKVVRQVDIAYRETQPGTNVPLRVAISHQSAFETMFIRANQKRPYDTLPAYFSRRGQEPVRADE